MCEIVRKIGGYEGQFSCKEHQLLINVVHHSRAEMLFSRLTDQHFPEDLKDIADNILELFDIIREIADDRIIVSQKNQLILVIGMGKKLKEFTIGLEKAQISNEESLKTKVDKLQRQLQKKTFEAHFFKEQYLFLLKNLQLKPQIEELQTWYSKGDVEQLFKIESESELRMSQNSLSSSIKVGGSVIKEDYKCPADHVMKKDVATHTFYACNICKKSIPINAVKWGCRKCDFDSCMVCMKIPPQNRKYCPKMHALSFGKAKSYEDLLCNRCKKTLKYQQGYSCIQCSYDLCKDCI